MLYLHFAPFSLRKIQHAGIGQPITVINSEFVSRTFGEASRSFLVSHIMMLPEKGAPEMLFRLYCMGTIGTHNDRGFCVSKDTMSGFVLPFQNPLLPNLLLAKHEGVQVHILVGVGYDGKDGGLEVCKNSGSSQ